MICFVRFPFWLSLLERSLVHKKAYSSIVWAFQAFISPQIVFRFSPMCHMLYTEDRIHCKENLILSVQRGKDLVLQRLDLPDIFHGCRNGSLEVFSLLEYSVLMMSISLLGGILFLKKFDLTKRTGYSFKSQILLWKICRHYIGATIGSLQSLCLTSTKCNILCVISCSALC